MKDSESVPRAQMQMGASAADVNSATLYHLRLELELTVVRLPARRNEFLVAYTAENRRLTMLPFSDLHIPFSPAVSLLIHTNDSSSLQSMALAGIMKQEA